MINKMANLTHSLAELARLCVDNAGSRSEAVESLVKRARSDQRLASEVIGRYRDEALALACQLAIKDIYHHDRSGILSAAARGPQQDTLTPLLERTERLLDRVQHWALPDGTHLPKATFEQVRKAAENAQANETAWRMRRMFYEEIARRGAPHEIVGDRLNTDDLLEIAQMATQRSAGGSFAPPVKAA